jgi:hypothetical protein
MWEVRTYASQVEVTGVHLGSGAPLVGLVIDFQDNGGKTIAYAHLHHMFKNDDTRRDITLKAFEICKAQEPAKVVEVVKPEIKLSRPTITKKAKSRDIINE